MSYTERAIVGLLQKQITSCKSKETILTLQKLIKDIEKGGYISGNN